MKQCLLCNLGSSALPLAAVLALLTAAAVRPDPLDEAIDTGVAASAAASRSQKRVDKLSDQTDEILQEYRQVLQETETLVRYNDYLRRLIASQRQEKASLQHQMELVETTQMEIIPLMQRMLESLDTFITLDVPFLAEERRERVERLKALMDRADTTTAEKFRRILEAFQIENEYGNTIEAYRGDLEIAGVTRPVDFLRIGRVGLLYQTLDGSVTGFWNRETGRWETLPVGYRKAVRDGLRVARKETAPRLLEVPVPVPEAVK